MDNPILAANSSCVCSASRRSARSRCPNVFNFHHRSPRAHQTQQGHQGITLPHIYHLIASPLCPQAFNTRKLQQPAEVISAGSIIQHKLCPVTFSGVARAAAGQEGASYPCPAATNAPHHTPGYAGQAQPMTRPPMIGCQVSQHRPAILRRQAELVELHAAEIADIGQNGCAFDSITLFQQCKYPPQHTGRAGFIYQLYPPLTAQGDGGAAGGQGIQLRDQAAGLGKLQSHQLPPQLR